MFESSAVCVWIYTSKVAADHLPNLLIRVSQTPSKSITMVPPALIECVPTRLEDIPCQYRPVEMTAFLIGDKIIGPVISFVVH